jgi:hypothetical protein
MISDSTKLKGILFGLTLIGLILAYYVTYLILKSIHASEYLWFVWIFSVIFNFIVASLKIGSENYDRRIKNLESRLDRIERERFK